MSDQVVPIRSGIAPSCDVEREMIDYVTQRVKAHMDEYGEAPVSIAMVTESAKGRMGHSFSLKPAGQHDKMATCASAAAILLERAVK